MATKPRPNIDLAAFAKLLDEHCHKHGLTSELVARRAGLSGPSFEHEAIVDNLRRNKSPTPNTAGIAAQIAESLGLELPIKTPGADIAPMGRVNRSGGRTLSRGGDDTPAE